MYKIWMIFLKFEVKFVITNGNNPGGVLVEERESFQRAKEWIELLEKTAE